MVKQKTKLEMVLSKLDKEDLVEMCYNLFNASIKHAVRASWMEEIILKDHPELKGVI